LVVQALTLQRETEFNYNNSICYSSPACNLEVPYFERSPCVGSVSIPTMGLPVRHAGGPRKAVDAAKKERRNP